MATIAAPPRVLTMEEYSAEWQPQGWRLIIIGPTSTWRQDWGEWEAIRDIVQNALDECEYYTGGYDEQGLFIRDVGKGIAVADFLLGPPKLKPDYARGKFGEGLKIAALALLRMGYPVRVETVGRELWLFFLEQKVNGHAETLAALSGDPADGEAVPSFMSSATPVPPSRTGLPLTCRESPSLPRIPASCTSLSAASTSSSSTPFPKTHGYLPAISI